MTSKTTLVIGNSHTNAIIRALEREPRPGFEALNILIGEQHPRVEAKHIVPAMIEADRYSTIVCSFGGSEHTVLGLLEAPQPFDFRTPETDEADPARAAIPYAMVEALLTSMLVTPLINWRVAREAFDGPIYQLASPPPFRDPPTGIVWPTLFNDKLERGFTPASIRMKLYRTHCAVVRAACAALDIGYIEHPRRVVDPDGFLLKRYWTREPTHGNARYGSLVLDQIAALARNRQPEMAA